MKRLFRVLPYTVLIIILVTYFVMGPRNVLDYYLAWRYEPTSDVAALESIITFTDNGKRIFYASNPEVVDSRDAFRTDCRDSEVTIVLGCYVNEKKIYVLNVDDKRLAGIEEVTTVHEFLHAVYARLSPSEKKEIDQLTENYAATITNETFKKTIELYRQKDASSIPNELHSIIGSEYGDLPKKLEEHYAKYILNRSKIVSLAGAYSSVFTSLEAQIKEYDSSLKTMEASISSIKDQLAKTAESLATERSNLESQRGVLSPDQFNVLVRAFNRRVADYNARIDTLNTEVIAYNSTIEKRNAIVLTQESLYESIDTRSLPDKL